MRLYNKFDKVKVIFLCFMGFCFIAGCLLIAYSPAVAIFYFSTLQLSYLSILTVISYLYLELLYYRAFVWTIIFALTLMLGTIFSNIYLSAFLTELSRYIGYFIYAFAFSKATISVPRDPSKKNLVAFGLSSASGIIVAESIFLYGDIFMSTLEDGVNFEEGCYYPHALIMAFRCLSFTLLNTCFNIFAFYSFASSNYYVALLILVLHLVACGITNLSMEYCVVQTSILLGMTVVVVLATGVFIRNKIKQD